MLEETPSVHRASRELVRELGFLTVKDAATSVSLSRCHALIEIDARGTLLQGELPGLLRLDKSTTSRIVAELTARGWVKARASSEDARARVLTLTAAGRTRVGQAHREANARVERALGILSDEERGVVARGLQLYARALERARLRTAFVIRPMKATDREAVAALIRTVMPEFGAIGPGYAIEDPEVDDMFSAYGDARASYFVVTGPDGGGDVVVGGGGFAPLQGGDADTCELRKMYFYRGARGLGIGQELLGLCIDGARRAKFARMYIETLRSMSQARALYERNGFLPVDAPLGKTGHFGCDAFYARDL